MNENKIDNNNTPLVGIVMGSESDLKVMKMAAQIMEELKIGYEIKVVSAHRTPDRMYEYSNSAEKRGLDAIIAGAGGAAHLPGMISSMTLLPVIGVPIKLRELDGMDSLLSIVQMPGGVPVATVGINNAKNAGILAARILGIKYPEIRIRLDNYIAKIRENVVFDLDDKLAEIWDIN
jgi:5-(carboxyamino)imidazole ribonucleotide mutase